MSTLFDEAEADAAVNLITEREFHKMNVVLFKDAETGNVRRATESEFITREDLQSKVDKHQRLADQYRAAVENYDKLAGSNDVPILPEAPAALEQPAPVPPAPVVPEDPVGPPAPSEPTPIVLT